MPYIVRQCVEEVEKRGIEEVGIYRISGVATDIQALKAVFDASESGKPSWASWGFCRFSGGSCAPHFPHPPWKGRRARAGSSWEGKVSGEQAQWCKNIVSFCQHPISQTKLHAETKSLGRKHTLCAVRPKQVTWPSLTLVEQGDVLL